MTIIVYRDGVMASDSQVSAGRRTCGSMKKITKSKDGWLAGGAGKATDIVKFLDWVEDGRNPLLLPKYDDFLGFLVAPDGTVLSTDETGVMMDIKAPFHAEGAGADCALGALEMGATAEEAVKIAIKYIDGCGGKVKKVWLDKHSN